MNYIKHITTFVLIISIVFSVSIKGQDVVPTKNEEIYSLEVANVKMEVDASFGGRIISYKMWTSPQSEWVWPPDKEIDENQYEANILGNKIYMLSDNVADLDITVSKYYYGNTADTSITIDYSLINTLCLSKMLLYLLMTH